MFESFHGIETIKTFTRPYHIVDKLDTCSATGSQMTRALALEHRANP